MFQDGTFSLADFTDAYQENEVQRVIRAYENSISIDVHCSTSGGGDWAKLPEMPFVKYCKIRVNPTDILDSGSQAIKDFIGKCFFKFLVFFLLTILKPLQVLIAGINSGDNQKSALWNASERI